jgi:hypothetical protein
MQPMQAARHDSKTATCCRADLFIVAMRLPFLADRQRLAALYLEGEQVMVRRPYKSKKRGFARFVQLHEWMLKTPAWRSLPPGPRALYIEIKRRFNGSNNGEIFLSHRDAADALAVHRNTVGPWFKMLEDRGFIFMTRAPHLGPSGIGQASIWGLSEEPTPDGRPALETFMKFKSPAQNLCMAVTKRRTCTSTRQAKNDQPS